MSKFDLPIGPGEQAVDWVLRQHSPGWSTADAAALDAWLAEGEENRRQYARAQVLWQNLGEPRSVPTALLEEAARRGRARVAVRRRRRLQVGLASAAALLLAVAANLGLDPGPDRYRTGLGEHRSFELADGSLAELNTDSELEAAFSKSERRLKLFRGEAYFSVRHDRDRPFTVAAGTGEVRDIGTRFDVRIDPGRVAVAVDEGEVEVRTAAAPPVRMTAGQLSSYDQTGHIAQPERGKLRQTTAWREGRMIVAAKPLVEVLAELGRYHTVQWEFADPTLKNLQLTGSFAVGNLPRFLDILQETLPVTVQRLDRNRVRITRARD